MEYLRKRKIKFIIKIRIQGYILNFVINVFDFKFCDLTGMFCTPE